MFRTGPSGIAVVLTLEGGGVSGRIPLRCSCVGIWRYCVASEGIASVPEPSTCQARPHDT